MYVCTNMGMYVCMYQYGYVCTSMGVYVCICQKGENANMGQMKEKWHVCMYVCINMDMYVCTHVCFRENVCK